MTCPSPQAANVCSDLTVDRHCKWSTNCNSPGLHILHTDRSSLCPLGQSASSVASGTAPVVSHRHCLAMCHHPELPGWLPAGTF